MGREGVAVVPTGNERAAGGFNVWAEGHFSIYDDDAAGSEEGNFFIGHTGADLALTESILVGVMAQLDWTDSRIDDGKTDGTGWMVGPYVSAEVARGVFFDARAMWGQSQNSIRQEIQGFDYHGKFDTERWLAEAILSGNLEAGAFTLTPDLRFTYIRENQKGYSVTDGVTTVDVNGQQVDLGQLSVGLRAGHLMELDGANVRTYVAGRLFWDIENPDHLTLGGGEVSTDDLRAAITLGLDVATERSRFGLEATYDGLLSNDLDAIGGRVSWTHQF
jgi:outer membrane autotransporter protein